MSRLRHRVGEAIANWRLWRPGERVAVAVSGGLDSACLLDLLLETRGWHRGQLEVVTVDHGTRPGSAADADFVDDIAAGRALPLVRFDLHLGEEASEATCRHARFQVFDSLDADVVALAHHRDDQAETVLVNLLRGTGPAGLEGMAWRRGRYVRPLLDISRAELEAWAAERGLAWREDPTNASPQFLRNRIRAEVMPVLERIREGATEAVARSASLAALQGALMDRLLEEDPRATHGEKGWERSWVAEAPEALVRRALHGEIDGLRTTHASAILQAARRGSGTVQLSPEHEVTITREWVRVG
ncbi:MAG: tRNA lysidine(34) synthetase TilS [Deltaproteobacteria bacterium]|nr:tRNA lysidine(34) synthetase TilS [Deltaproteobacteria bacterium]MBW2253288.1 tRNA lysidine(34) synthetase TilS [Deltaproteobacteria bacterium]